MATDTKVQITVRLPTKTVAWLDKLIREGGARSRADAFTQIAERDERRRVGEEAAATYAVEAQREPSEEEKSYREWLTNRRLPPMKDGDDMDWEAVTSEPNPGA